MAQTPFPGFHVCSRSFHQSGNDCQSRGQARGSESQRDLTAEGGGGGWKPADSQHFAQSITEYLTLMYNFSFIMVQTVLSCVCRTENSEISLYKFK